MVINSDNPSDIEVALLELTRLQDSLGEYLVSDNDDFIGVCTVKGIPEDLIWGGFARVHNSLTHAELNRRKLQSEPNG